MIATIQSLSPASRDARDRIEAAALALFAECPAASVRLDEIATRAGASLTTIYRHYGDKQTLLAVCALGWADRLAERMIDHLTAVQTPKDRLRKVFWVVLDFFEQHPAVARMMLGSVYPGAMRRDTTQTQHRLTELLTGVLAEGRAAGVLNRRVSEGILLDYFYGVLARLVQMAPLRQNEAPLTDQTDELFEMLWRAIATPEPETKLGR